MTFTNTRRSYNGMAIFALLWAVAAIYLIIQIVVTDDMDDIPLILFVLTLTFFTLILPSLFAIDIFLWHFFGNEIISTNETELEIRKVGRLFKKKKKIKLNQIKDIYLWQKKVKHIHSAFSFWGISWQGTLCVKYKNNKKYYIGVNMPNWEAEELREELLQEIDKLVQN